MENSNYSNHLITKKIFVEHISVVFIFSVLTVIFTFPVILDFVSEAAGFECYDKCHMMWRFWWADFSFENNLDFQHSNPAASLVKSSITGNVKITVRTVKIRITDKCSKSIFLVINCLT